MVITTPLGRGFTVFPGRMFKLYPPVIPNLCMGATFVILPCLLAPSATLLFLNKPSSLTFKGLLHLPFCQKSSHYSGISSNITSSVVPNRVVSQVTLCLTILFYFLFSILSLLEMILFIIYYSSQGLQKTEFLNCSLIYPQCLE